MNRFDISQTSLNVCLSIVTLLFLPNASDSFNIPKLIILYCFLFYWNIQLLKKKSFHFSKKLRIAIGTLSFYLISFIISGLSHNEHYRFILGEWRRGTGFLFYLGLSILVFNLALSRTKYDLKKFFLIFIFIANLNAIYILSQSRGNQLFDWNSKELFGTFGNNNFVSQFLGLALIVNLVLIFSTTNIQRRVFLTLSLAVNVLGLLILNSKQGLIIPLISLTIMLVLHIIFRISSFSNIKKIASYFTIFILISCFVVFLSFYSFSISSFKDRVFFWQTAVNIIKSNWLSGIGVDAFAENYKLYRTSEAYSFRQMALQDPLRSIDGPVDNAHNIYLHLGSTLGVPSLIIFVLFFLVIMFFAVQNYLYNPSLLQLCLASVWISYCLSMTVTIDNISIAIWGWVLAGLILNQSNHLDFVKNSKLGTSLNKNKLEKSKSISERRHSFAFINLFNFFATSVLLSFILFGIGKMSSYLQYDIRANSIIPSSETILALQREKIEIPPEFFSEIMRISKSSYFPQTTQQLADFMYDLGLTDFALDIAESNSVRFPRYFASWHFQATVLENMGDYSKAVYFREKSLALDPRNELLARQLANVRERIERGQIGEGLVNSD